MAMSKLLSSKTDKKHGAYLIDKFGWYMFYLRLRTWDQDVIDGSSSLKEMRYKGYR